MRAIALAILIGLGSLEYAITKQTPSPNTEKMMGIMCHAYPVNAHKR